MSQEDLIFSYFKNRPLRDIPHAEVVDWATAEWEKRTGEKFRDPDRAIRKLHERGLLIKTRKGVYRYDPDAATERELCDFTPQQKEEIFRRDGYKCCICGDGKKNGIEIHADHIRPRALGGESTVQNGQTLCAPHNFRKQKFGQTETGKKMFIRLHGLAQESGDKSMAEFCRRVLEVYEELKINGHIPWNEKPPVKPKGK